MYRLELEIPGLPPTANSGVGRKGSKNWKATWRGRRDWTEKVKWACLGKQPKAPLEKARVIVTRHSSVEPDFDCLVISAKALIDGLTEAKVIKDDNRACIGIPVYNWEKAAPGKGKVRIVVEELC